MVDHEIEAMRPPFVVLLIAMPALKARELKELVSERGLVGARFEKELSHRGDLLVTKILLPLVALVWTSVAFSLFRPSPAPNRTQQEIQDTLAATVVYPLP
jgi:hypothetical protein